MITISNKELSKLIDKLSVIQADTNDYSTDLEKEFFIDHEQTIEIYTLYVDAKLLVKFDAKKEEEKITSIDFNSCDIYAIVSEDEEMFITLTEEQQKLLEEEIKKDIFINN